MLSGLRVVWALALRTATERLGVNRAGAPVLAAAAQGQHELEEDQSEICLLYTSPSPRDGLLSRMPSSA